MTRLALLIFSISLTNQRISQNFNVRVRCFNWNIYLLWWLLAALDYFIISYPRLRSTHLLDKKFLWLLITTRFYIFDRIFLLTLIDWLLGIRIRCIFLFQVLWCNHIKHNLFCTLQAFSLMRYRIGLSISIIILFLNHFHPIIRLGRPTGLTGWRVDLTAASALVRPIILIFVL